MGLFDALIKIIDSNEPSNLKGIISTGKQRQDGGHDHRYNTGNDRTPAQRDGDKKRRED
ncbi:hypothetical protein [Rahnella sp. Larv3_ips]|uniref:hypothetical protein n=1 Tax=Rahnella sp. Larv3_ips TaxID=1896943 RepID=UPI0013CEE19C|nr:hypothetical protein [Rahnella sp. Larv3_ips]